MFQRETTDSLQDTFSCVLLRAREDALKTLFWNQYIRGETIVKTKMQMPATPALKKSCTELLGVHRRNQQDRSSKIQHEITKEHLEERKGGIHAWFKISLSLLVIKPKKKA